MSEFWKVIISLLITLSTILFICGSVYLLATYTSTVMFILFWVGAFALSVGCIWYMTFLVKFVIFDIGTTSQSNKNTKQGRD